MTTINDIQQRVMTTCMESSNNVAYMFLNLLGEVGETADKMADHMLDKRWAKELKRISAKLQGYGLLAKQIRKEPDTLQVADIRNAFARLAFIESEAKEELSKEIGDIGWQWFGLCQVLNLMAEDVMQQNYDKLHDREQRNVIDGDGDNR